MLYGCEVDLKGGFKNQEAGLQQNQRGKQWRERYVVHMIKVKEGRARISTGNAGLEIPRGKAKMDEEYSTSPRATTRGAARHTTGERKHDL